MSRDKLIEDNMNLVYYLINRYYPNYNKDEDVIQEGMVGLVKAADRWDESKGKFSTFASKCILNQIKRYFIVQSRHFYQLSLDTVLPVNSLDDGTSATFADLVVDESGDVDFELIEDEEFVSELDDLDREILAYYQKGYRQFEICKILGIHKSTVHARIAKMRKRWEK